jgi:hypothetical protein
MSSIAAAPMSNLVSLASGSPNVVINFSAFTGLGAGRYQFLLTIPNQSTGDKLQYRDMLVLTN